ncbi:MAG: MiaB/RimO family radical SAM methylthiotransferase [Gemmatimonas sp.]|nr:MiaB/RimO family radical SAM methylthiotransferase [Gemmatimonadaceae bacterium]
MKVYLRTFGCRANHYDSEVVRAMLETSGHAIVSSPAEADVAVFNSCAVTSDAEADLRKVVRHASREQPALRSVVMGCAAALDDDRAEPLRIRSLPTVQRVIAGADLPAIAEALDLAPVAMSVLTRAQTGARALLRIQDGCDEHCTFCATTLARGANRSRPADDLVNEAIALAERHAEIVITGIHIGTYGADIGSSLGALMLRLVREVSSVRFRLSSIEATELDDALVELLVGAPRHLVPHVHAPLQSGADRVLRRMGRHWYSASSYASAIERLAARMPVLGLGADVIAGFPGETEQDHLATVELIEQLPFTYLHVFPYSRRPGTAADRLRDHLAPPLVSARAAELRALAARKAAAYRVSRSGGTADVIAIGGRAERDAMTGDYLSVMLADPTIPRGARFTARLALEQDRLLAVPVDQ